MTTPSETSRSPTTFGDDNGRDIDRGTSAATASASSASSRRVLSPFFDIARGIARAGGPLEVLGERAGVEDAFDGIES